MSELREHETVQQAKSPGTMISGTTLPLTVGEIRNAIAYVDDDVEITFGSTSDGTPLRFCRFKIRGDNLLQIELNEYE